MPSLPSTLQSKGASLMTLDDCPPVLTVEQAAQVALVDPKSIRKAIHRGELKALASGRLIRIHRDALKRWLMGEIPLEAAE